MNNKIVKRFILGAFICIVIGVFVYRYRLINTKYPAPTINKYSLAEDVFYNDFILSVLSYEFMSDDDIKDIFPVEYEVWGDFACIIVDLNIKNNSNQESNLEVYNFILESDTWRNGINQNAFNILNDYENNEKKTLVPVLDSEEEITLRLPFTLLPNHFRQWYEIEDREYGLTINLYPTKEVIIFN